LATINEASQQALLARQQLTAKQREVQTAQERLRKAEAALPRATSQQNLRQKIGAGLKGMLLRKKVTQAKEQIGKQKQIISSYGTQLKQFEETQLKPVEAQISEAQSKEASYKEAQRAFDKGLSVKSDFQNPYTKSYLEKMYFQRDMAQDLFNKQISDIQATLPEGDKLVIDYKNMRVAGIESGSLDGSYSIDEYNKQVAKVNQNIKEMPEIESIKTDLLKSDLGSRDMSTLGRIKAFTGNVISTDIIPTVSAKSSYSANETEDIGLLGNIKNFVLGKREIYSPELKGFVSASEPSGQATAFIRPASQQELADIDKLGKIGQFVFGTDKKSQNILTADIRDISNLYKTAPETNIKTGLFGFGDRVVGELTWLENIENKPLTQVSRGLGTVVGGTLGGVLGSLLPKEGIYTRPAYNTTIYTPQFGTMQINPVSGKPVSGYSKIEIPEQKFFTSSQAQKVGQFVGEVSPYLIPGVGGYVFYGEQAERLGSDISQTGGYKPGSIKWFLDDPLTSSIAVGIPIFKGIKISSKQFSKDIKDLGKWLESEIKYGIFKRRPSFGGGGRVGKAGSLQLIQYADEVVETTYKGQKVKVLKSQLLNDLRNKIKRSSDYQVKEFIKNQIKQISKNSALTQADKAKRLKNLYLFIQEARGNVIVSSSGEVSSVLNIGSSPSQYTASYAIKPTNIFDDLVEAIKKRTKTKTSSEMFPLASAQTTDDVLSIQSSQLGETNWLTGSVIKTASISNKAFSASQVGETNWLSDSFMDVSQQTKQRQRTDVLSLSRLDQRSKQQTRQKQDQFQDPLLRSLTSQVPDLKTGQRTVQTPSLNIRTAQKPKQDPLTPSRPRPTRPKKPEPQKTEDTLKIRLPRKKERKKKKLPLSISSRGEEFLAITKRRGKELILGRTKTPERAAQIARKSVLGTLGATAKVRSTKGRQIKLREDKIFRTSKTDPLAIVQRKTARLRSLGERKEIKSSRRKPFNIL